MYIKLYFFKVFFICRIPWFHRTFRTDCCPRTDQENWENSMTEKFQFLKYKKFISKKSFSRITYRRILVILERFLRSQEVPGVLQSPGGRNWSQESQKFRGSWGFGTGSHFFKMPGYAIYIQIYIYIYIYIYLWLLVLNNKSSLFVC